jgi:putative lipoprotein (rSAM/lipoprotein system)
MKKPIIKFFDKIILLLLGLSGTIFYACPKYGELVAEYRLNGTVTDKTQAPIKNIRVVNLPYENAKHGDTLYTNEQGRFGFDVWSGTSYLKIEDIDGEENGGEFLPTAFDVQFTNADRVRKGNRNKGPDLFLKNVNVTLYREGDGLIVLYGPPQAPFEP